MLDVAARMGNIYIKRSIIQDIEMITPVWDEKLATHVRVLDKDHKGLLEIVARLERQHLEDRGEEHIAATISSLLLCTVEHFEREERFLWKAGYPRFQDHKALHDRFREMVMALQELYLTNPGGIDLMRAVRFLGEWLIEHISQEDADFVPYVRGEKPGVHEAELGEARNPKIVEINLKLPENKATLIEGIAETLTHGGPISNQLHKALEEVLEHQRKYHLQQAKNLFSG